MGSESIRSKSGSITSEEDNLICNEQITMEEQTQQTLDSMEITQKEANKRGREIDGEELWQQVKRNSKKQQNNENIPIQICVTSKDKLPRQFALAKLLQSQNITDITRVKYVNPYKILITFEKQYSADKFVACEEFTKRGWRCQRTLEVGLSYGIIRNIDIDTSEEEFLKYVVSPVDVISARRLRQRSEEGWEASESIKIGFKGSSLPTYVYIYDLRVLVEPFVFPVTQCSRCWRFGHSIKMCPSKRITCPKCTKNHANCEAVAFKCSNCSGPHMSLEKICPVYRKEKRIRELMAEFNCTYQKALTIYVPPSPPTDMEQGLHQKPTSQARSDQTTESTLNNIAYSEVVKRTLYKKNLEKARSGHHSVPLAEKTLSQPSENPTLFEISMLETSDDSLLDESESRSKRSRPKKDKLNRSERAAGSHFSTTATGPEPVPNGPKVSRARPTTFLRAPRTSDDDDSVDYDYVTSNTRMEHAHTDDSVPGHSGENKQFRETITFNLLLQKLKRIIFKSKDDGYVIFQNVLKVLIEWIISSIISNFSDVSVIKKFWSLLFNCQNG